MQAEVEMTKPRIFALNKQGEANFAGVIFYNATEVKETDTCYPAHCHLVIEKSYADKLQAALCLCKQQRNSFIRDPDMQYGSEHAENVIKDEDAEIEKLLNENGE